MIPWQSGVMVVALTGLAAPTSGATSDQPSDVLLVVAAPADTPVNEIHCIASVDGWRPPGTPLPRVAPGLFAGPVDWRPGVVEYKFCRLPDWRGVEKSADGSEIRNRRASVGAGAPQVIFHVVQRWTDRPAPTTQPTLASLSLPLAIAQSSTRTGDLRAISDVPGLDGIAGRNVLVWLPPGYDEHAGQRYPVLYLLDGQNVFDAATSFSGVEWGADETADRLVRAGRIKPLIIVAVENTMARVDEYTPVPDAARGGGQADAYLRWMIAKLKPRVDQAFRTNPSAADTVIAGSSLGGLLALHAIHTHPDIFGGAGVISPSLWWANNWILEEVAARPLDRRSRVLIQIGEADGYERTEGKSVVTSVTRCQRLEQILAAQKLAKLRLTVIPQGLHHEETWAAHFDELLLFMFGSDADAATPAAQD